MRRVGTAPRGPAGLAMLIPWFRLCGWPLVWASLQLLLQRSSLETNKAIVFIPGKCIDARALCTVPRSGSGPTRLRLVVSHWITEGSPSHPHPSIPFALLPTSPLSPRAQAQGLGHFFLLIRTLAKRNFFASYYNFFLLITRKPQTCAELHDPTDHISRSLLNCG